MGITFNEEKGVSVKNKEHQLPVPRGGIRISGAFILRKESGGGRGLHPGPPSPWFRGESV